MRVLHRPRRAWSRALAAMLTVGLCSDPVLARAERRQLGPEATAPSEPQADDPVAEAKRLYDAGAVEFDTAEYLAAIKLWTRAYALLPNTPESADIKRYIINNLAVARERQYAIDGDVGHLKRALILARNYADNIDALFGEGERADQERRRTEEFLARVQAKVDAAEARTATPPVTEPKPVTPGEDRGPAPTPEDPQRGRKAIVAGAVLLGVGGATGVLLLTGIGLGAAANDVDDVREDKAGREQQFDRGRAGNTLAIVGAVTTPLLLAAGIALVVVGHQRRKRSRVAFTPSVGAGGVGVLLRGRF